MLTERLLLRAWQESDRAPFAALNADPAVMEHFPAPLTRSESDALIDRHPGLFAVEVRESGAFIGFVGLAVPTFDASFTPCVEIGWRLAHEAWGHGYATEAARAVLAQALTEHERIVSFTAVGNLRSRAVMERIGMHPAGEFEHPNLPQGHRLRRHVLYTTQATSAEPS
jgi:RimJ/RimL family protein N-acetyltransferase